MSAVFPGLPFHGQIFIDAFRIKWQFDQSSKCWQRMGTVPQVPVATELQPGLLSARLKQLLNGIPQKGGHFGIITNPLLKLKNDSPQAIVKDKVFQANRDDSGTIIFGQLPINGRGYTNEQFAGKILRFKSGTLVNKTYLVFTNDNEKIYLDGDATLASKNDGFEIIDSVEYNPNGVLTGDIVLVSESIDITCVDRNGEPIPSSCGINKISADDPDNPPALNFQLNKNFLDNLCVTIPGCTGPTGNKGDKGEKGSPGTGDGPQGEQGDLGEDAPEIPHTFSGLKLVELDDIFDTAIVSLELDAANNRIGVIKAKVRTPEDDIPATQILSNPVSRSIRFTDQDTFDYDVLMPPLGDPIGEPDLALLKYPNKFIAGGEQETIVSKINLSDLVDKIVEYYENKLSDINDDYNQVLKEYINSKDEAARTILADLADEVTRCESQLPLDFCLGISPGDCNPVLGGDSKGFSKSGFVYPLASTLFSVVGDKIALDLGEYIITPKSSEVIKDDFTFIKFPDIDGPTSTVSLPTGGYVIQWIEGTIKSSATDYLIGSIESSEGLEAIFSDGGGPNTVVKMPVPTVVFNAKESTAVEFAYREAPIAEKSIAVEITSSTGGTIKLRANLPGINGQGSIKVKILQVDLT